LWNDFPGDNGNIYALCKRNAKGFPTILPTTSPSTISPPTSSPPTISPTSQPTTWPPTISPTTQPTTSPPTIRPTSQACILPPTIRPTSQPRTSLLTKSINILGLYLPLHVIILFTCLLLSAVLFCVKVRRSREKERMRELCSQLQIQIHMSTDK